MSRADTGKNVRARLLNKLWELGRVVSTETVFIHQAIAQSVGLNATDTKCVDLILRGPEGGVKAGGVTAGWLSERTGLTTGAITHILDRLEKRRFIERERDPQDRRKVMVRVRPEALAPLIPKYEAVGRAHLKLAEQYSDKELELICDYFEKSATISKAELARLIRENRPDPQQRPLRNPKKARSTRRSQ